MKRISQALRVSLTSQKTYWQGLLLSVLLCLPNMVAAEQLSGTFSKEHLKYLRIATSHSPNVPSRNIVVLEIEGLSGGCTRGIFFDATASPATHAVVMSAYLAGRTVVIGYDSSQPTPWGSTAFCAMTYFDIL